MCPGRGPSILARGARGTRGRSRSAQGRGGPERSSAEREFAVGAEVAGLVLLQARLEAGVDFAEQLAEADPAGWRKW